MKYIIFIWLLPCVLFAQKPVDKTKPVYQQDWGVMPPGNMWVAGGWSQRIQETHKLTPKERAAIEATANAAMYRKAAYASWCLAGLACIVSYLMKAREGVGVALICGLFSFASSFMASTAPYALRIGACAIIGIGVAVCFIPAVRDWSVSHLFKRRQ